MVPIARSSLPTRRALLAGSALGLLCGASGCALTSSDYRALKSYFSGQDIVDKSEVSYRLGGDAPSFIEVHLRVKDDTSIDAFVGMLRGAARKVGKKADVRIWVSWCYSGTLIDYNTDSIGLWDREDWDKSHDQGLLEWAMEIAQGSVQIVDVPSMRILYEAQDKLPDDFVLSAQELDRERVEFQSSISLPGWDIGVQATSDDDLSDFPLERILSSVPAPSSQGLRHRLEVDTYWNTHDGPYLNIGYRRSDDDGLAPIGKGLGNGRDLAAELIRAIRGAPVIERVSISLEDPTGPHYPEAESLYVSMSDGVISGPTYDTDDCSRRLLKEILG